MFDLGETLVDETRLWEGWADWLGIPHLTLLAALGAVIAREQDHREVFRLLRPDLDVAAETRRRMREAPWVWPAAEDLHDDARACLAELHRAGFRLGVAGNQSPAEEAAVRALALPVDFVGSSSAWGAQKPSPEFFERLVEAAATAPGEIAYVGDRIDNDVAAAVNAGLQPIFIRRGAWAWIQAGRAPLPEARLTIESLAELPDLLALPSR